MGKRLTAGIIGDRPLFYFFTAASGGRISQASEKAQLEDVLNTDEAELIKGIRELGGKLLIERFMGELEKIRQFIKGE